MTKICKQCGEIKPLDQYRKYYGGRKGHYSTCKQCEKINSREKYLVGKTALTDVEREELRKIYTLWEYQTKLGLRPPRRAKAEPVTLDDQIAQYAARVEAIHEDVGEAPAELIKWLTVELTEEPEYYQEEVCEDLMTRFRPQLRIDPATMLPVYDDTHRDVLSKIFARFDEYEDNYDYR